MQFPHSFFFKERCEQIAQVITKNEQMRESLIFLSKLLIRSFFFSQKTRDSLRNR